MIRQWMAVVLLAALATGCATARLERPPTPATRMIDPMIVLDDEEPVADAPDAVAVRLLGARSSDQIGFPILYRTSAGELAEDPVWSWSSRPHAYLETALYRAAASDPGVRFTDTSDASTMSVIFLSCYIEATGAGDQRLVASVELRLTAPDRTVSSHVLTAEESVSGEFPGNLAEVMGRLIRGLAADALASTLK